MTTLQMENVLGQAGEDALTNDQGVTDSTPMIADDERPWRRGTAYVPRSAGNGELARQRGEERSEVFSLVICPGATCTDSFVKAAIAARIVMEIAELIRT